MEIPYVLKKGGMYYAHNSAGYVGRVLMAELYSKEEALSDAAQCNEIQAIPINDILTSAQEVQEHLDRMLIMRDVMLSLEPPITDKEG